MPTYTQVVTQYNVNVVAGTAAALAAAVAAVPLDQSYLNLMAATVISDATNVVGTQVQRVITLALNAPPMLVGTNPQPKAFVGTIRSSSPRDAQGKDGARQVTINYTDPTTGAHAQTVLLNGTTPVTLTAADHLTIVSMAVAVDGGFGANVGQITIANDQGREVTYLPESFYTKYPAATDQATPWKEWMRKNFASAINYQVIAVAPVLS